MSQLPRRILDRVRSEELHEAVREFHDFLGSEPDAVRLRPEFARLLAEHGWGEEAFRQVRQTLAEDEVDGGRL
ncbi:MAG: hypothetical protein WC943_14875, partial [Elusimicrobiota bacterium]